LERFVLAIGTKELGFAIGHPALERGAGEALVGDDGEAGERDPLELLARDLSLGSICRGSSKAIVHRGLRVDVAVATPDFGGLRASYSQPAGNLESII
jgi:hypothetical protein